MIARVDYSTDVVTNVHYDNVEKTETGAWLGLRVDPIHPKGSSPPRFFNRRQGPLTTPFVSGRESFWYRSMQRPVVVLLALVFGVWYFTLSSSVSSSGSSFSRETSLSKNQFLAPSSAIPKV